MKDVTGTELNRASKMELFCKIDVFLFKYILHQHGANT